ncbi:MAG TPA: methyl-accepting chemotaxis protein [Candidatus Acidoferrum sp.]|nr:methyl-accepting chemotaxis protein [Candidatus Acidoferrum sp.]
MGIFNRILGGHDDDAGLREQETEVLQALNAANSGKDQSLRRQAAVLEAASTPMLLADESHAIVHANPAALKLLRGCEHDLRGALPSFNADALVGSKLDSLYPPSILQRTVFDALMAPRNDEFTHGNHHCRLTLSPVFDASRRRLGTLLEWQDLTDAGKQADALMAQLVAARSAAQAAADKLAAETAGHKKQLDGLAAAEHQFQQLMTTAIAAAGAGELGKRVDTSRLQGTQATLAAGVNDMIGNFETVVADANAALEALANGNLTRKLTQDYQGSFAVLKQALNATVDKLVSVVSDIQGSAVRVKHGAVEINNSNINLSSRTEQQAASLEETSAAMEEITTTVQQNAANAIQANNLARAARETAENGGQVVNKAVAAMQAISESSSKINEIIGVIDEIAFQTNLLALNAAVEAARAGDQGRGFAVVADEVRNLAGRSAKAAKEIKDLIKDSGEKVREGSNLVNKSGQTLDEIVMAVKKVNDIVAEISTASDEQAAGLDEINRAVSEMDTMTQQNASLVEQAAGAGRTLDEQAGMLETMIAFFDTGLAPHVVAREPAPRQPATAAKPAMARKPAPASAKPGAARTAKPAPQAKAAAKPAAPPARHDDEDKNWAEF